MTPNHPTHSSERLVRIDQMIERYRKAKQQRLLQRAVKLWRKAEAQQQFAALEAGPLRIH